MSETEPIQLPLAVMAGGRVQQQDGVNRRGGIAFNREELSQILNVYGRKVASGPKQPFKYPEPIEKLITRYKDTPKMTLIAYLGGGMLAIMLLISLSFLFMQSPPETAPPPTVDNNLF